MKLLGPNSYIIQKTIIIIQSHLSSFLFRLSEIWSVFSNQDRTTFPLVLIISRDSIADVSYTVCPRCKVGTQSILLFVQCIGRFTSERSASNEFDSFPQCCHVDLLVKSRQEKQLFASLTVQTPFLRCSKMWQKEFCKAKRAYRSGNGSSNQQPHTQPSALVRQNGRRVGKSINHVTSRNWWKRSLQPLTLFLSELRLRFYTSSML